MSSYSHITAQSVRNHSPTGLRVHNLILKFTPIQLGYVNYSVLYHIYWFRCIPLTMLFQVWFLPFCGTKAKAYFFQWFHPLQGIDFKYLNKQTIAIFNPLIFQHALGSKRQDEFRITLKERLCSRNYCLLVSNKNIPVQVVLRSSFPCITSGTSPVSDYFTQHMHYLQVWAELKLINFQCLFRFFLEIS